MKNKLDKIYFKTLEILIDLTALLLINHLFISVLTNTSELVIKIVYSITFISYVLYSRIFKVSITKRSALSVNFYLLFYFLIYTLIFYFIDINVIYNINITSVIILIILILLKLILRFIYLIYTTYYVAYFGNKEEFNTLLYNYRHIQNKKTGLKKIKYFVDICKLDQETFNLNNSIYNKADIYLLSDQIDSKLKDSIVNNALTNKKYIEMIPNNFEIPLYKSKIYNYSDKLVYSVNPLGLNLEQRLVKRFFDLIVSFCVLVILSPIILLIALSIKIDSKGPIFFRQKRVTLNHKHFNIIKFRSMIDNAESSTGAIQAKDDDNRITKVGNFIRRFRLDELPQLFNVLRGEMSIVGPRALRCEEVDDFIKRDSSFSHRFSVKAGITGIAQIIGKYDTNQKDKLRLDLFYICTYSFVNDIKIIIQTFFILFDKNSSMGVINKTELVKQLEKSFSIIDTEYGSFIKN